ncbi:MAG TPA: AtpZ/AtpI family protein [Bacillota bacterium]|jgi:F0F1-type ATP synthase assembly protein I|nr:AtpZ/AtpI family protein [Bacillota bacterium]
MGYVWMAVEFASFIAMGFVIGNYADSRYGTRPWGALAGFMIGLVGGALSVNRAVSELSTRERSRRKKR